MKNIKKKQITYNLILMVNVQWNKEFRMYSCLTLIKGCCYDFWFSVLIRPWELFQKGKREVSFYFEKQAQFSIAVILAI